MSESRLRHRLSVLSRCVAGIAGGYVLAQLSTVAFALAFPGGGEDLLSAAAILGISVFVASVIWAFSCATALRAWGGIGIPALLLVGCSWSLLHL